MYLLFLCCFCFPQKDSLVFKDPIGVDNNELPDSTFLSWGPGDGQSK